MQSGATVNNRLAAILASEFWVNDKTLIFHLEEASMGISGEDVRADFALSNTSLERVHALA